MGKFKNLSLEAQIDFNETVHPEKNLYARLSESLFDTNRMINKLGKLKAEGKLDLPLNERNLPF